LEFRKELKKKQKAFFFSSIGHGLKLLHRPNLALVLSPMRSLTEAHHGPATPTAPIAGPPCHPHPLDPVADSQPHRTHAENPEADETELDSTPDNKNQNRSRVKKSPSQNSNELHRFGAQTQDRISLEFKLPTPDPSPYK
jgi:hypothetical protein